MDRPSSPPEDSQAAFIMLCESNHEWRVTTAGEDPPPSPCPFCSQYAVDYKNASPLQRRQRHKAGCKCSHCSPDWVNPEDEKRERNRRRK